MQTVQRIRRKGNAAWLEPAECGAAPAEARVALIQALIPLGLELASRRVVGWAMRATLDADLALAALRMALAARRPAPGLVHHSDRGSQYASAEYRRCSPPTGSSRA